MSMRNFKWRTVFGLAAVLACAVPSVVVVAAADRQGLLAGLEAGGPNDKVSVASKEMPDRGYLGVNIQLLRHSLRRAFDIPEDVTGLLVSHVLDGSPAEKAGLKDKDVITRLDGRPVDDQEEFTRSVRGMKPDTEVAITIWRDGRSQELRARLGTVPDADVRRFVWKDGEGLSILTEPPEPGELEELVEPAEPLDIAEGEDLLLGLGRGGRLGVELQDLNEEIAGFFSVPGNKGALVWKVIEDSPASEAGLKAGDVIVEVEGKPVQDSQDLREILSDHDAGDTVALTFLRRGQSQTVRVTLAKQRHALWLSPGDLRGLDRDNLDIHPGRAPAWRERLREELKELKNLKGIQEFRIQRRQLPHSLRDRTDLQRTMDRLQREMERLQERMSRLKEDLGKLRD